MLKIERPYSLSKVRILFVSIMTLLMNGCNVVEDIPKQTGSPIAETISTQPNVKPGFFVSLTGNDTNDGSEGAPFRTLGKAMKALASKGGMIYIRGGVYNEGLRWDGTIVDAIQIQAYPGEKVLFQGGRVLKGEWSPYTITVPEVSTVKVYKTKLSVEEAKAFEANGRKQVFSKGQGMHEARWPNVPKDDFWSNEDGNFWKYVSAGTRYEPKGESFVGTVFSDALKNCGIDWNGGKANLNAAHQFYTWTRDIENFDLEKGSFTYSALDRSADEYGSENPWKKRKILENRFYLFGKLEALDVPGEWYYDEGTKELYVFPWEGGDYNSIMVKTTDFIFDFSNTNDITIKGIDFVGTTVRFVSSKNCTLDSLNVDYPSFERELYDSRLHPDRDGDNPTLMNGDGHVVKNCVIKNSFIGGIEIRGTNSIVENCLVENCSITGSLRHPAIRLWNGKWLHNDQDINLKAVRNTVRNSGGPGIVFSVCPGFAELNRLFNVVRFSRDNESLRVSSPAAKGTVFRYNWLYDCVTFGFDGVYGTGGLGMRGDDLTRGVLAYRNVMVNNGLTGIIAKGDYNGLYHMTSYFGKEHVNPKKAGLGIIIPTKPTVKRTHEQRWASVGIHGVNLDAENPNSRVVNNIAHRIVGSHKGESPKSDGLHKGLMESNEMEKDSWYSELVDPDQFDFRPKAGSRLIDSGADLVHLKDKALETYTGNSIAEVIQTVEDGKADIGAYEAGVRNYWIPGRKEILASSPIPIDGSRVVREREDVMWLMAYEAVSNDVYVGSNESSVMNATKSSSEYQGNQLNNIFEIENLQKGNRYFWRVDSVMKDGSVKRGKAWKFVYDVE